MGNIVVGKVQNEPACKGSQTGSIFEIRKMKQGSTPQFFDDIRFSQPIPCWYNFYEEQGVLLQSTFSYDIMLILPNNPLFTGMERRGLVVIVQKLYVNYRKFLVCCLILIVIVTILSSCGQSVSNKETDLPESGLQSGNGSEEGDDSSVSIEEEANSDELWQQGIAYEEGQGVEKDIVKAVELYRQAVDLGNADAMYRLAMCYMNGNGVEPEAIIGQQMVAESR